MKITRTAKNRRETAGKLVALLAVILSVAVTNGTVITGDDAAERIVLSNRVVLVYRTSGEVKVNKSGTVDVLVVGGGGGGGANSSNFGGGGGGAGGVIHRSAFSVAASDEPYTVTVGTGGTAGTPSFNATAGGDSSVFGLTAYGGGAGAKYGGNAGGDGASGGGGTATNGSPDVPYDGGLAVHGDQGNVGGAAAANRFGCGGGGGAGSVGGNGDAGTPGAGGDGIVCNIIGPNVWYGGGGAGFRKGYSISGGVGGGGSCVKTSSSASTAGAGVDGLGGGGCGGANGGSGVVILSFELGDSIDDADGFTLSGGDYTIPFLEETAHVFTNSGTLTVTGDGMVEILAVGGGGGGGKGHASNSNYGGAGGGGGGVAHFAALPVTAGTYNIVVGAGGEIDANGGDTKALDVIAFGGGAGAQYDSRSSSVDPAGMIGNDGASGGGTCHASWYPPDGTFDAENVDEVSGGKAKYALYGNAGNAGGSSFHQYYPGGGGGAGAPGGAGSSASPGAGGDGLPVSITGAEVYYGGGGAGARYNASYPSAVGGLGGGGAIGENGTDGLGGGGSGNRKGGSGVVIIRYRKKPIYAEEFADATGGVMRRRNGHRIHTFAVDGTFTMPCVGKIEVLLVGGGGGGGANGTSYGGGGGGGGGVVYTNIVAVAGEYRIRIGAGGGVGENGGNSSAFGLVAYGGGCGADSYEGSNPTDVVGTQGGGGASGGGATHTRYGPSENMLGGEAVYGEKGNRGNAGGGAGHVFGPGGGGGAGGIGETASSTVPGAGGEGWLVDISGSMVCYGGGGAGFRKGQSISGGVGGGGSCVKTSSSASTADAGVDGLGGGGCGGANGGSGVVIIRYKLPLVGTMISIR